MRKDIDKITLNDITGELLNQLTEEESDYIYEKFFSDMEKMPLNEDVMKSIAEESAEYDAEGNIIEFKGAWDKKNYPLDENGNIMTWWE